MAGTPAHPRRADWRWWIGTMVALLAVAATVFFGIQAHQDAGSASGATAQQTSITSKVPPIGGNSGADAETTSQASSCLNSQSQPLSCSEPHRYESLGPGPCDVGRVVSYLGGTVGLDVPYPTGNVAVRPQECVVDFAKDHRGSWGETFGSVYGPDVRRCVAGQESLQESWKAVPCSERHFGEFVSTGSTEVPTEQDCAKRATTYLNHEFDTLLSQLTIGLVVEPAKDANDGRCLIKTRGEQALIGSLRLLGNANVPFA